MTEFKPHISKFKKKEVEHIKQLFKEYPVAGIANLEGLPGLMLQRIKHSLKQDLVLKITKKRLMKIAIDQIQDKKDIKILKQKLEGIPALVFSKEDPFMLYKKIDKSKASAPAKAGQKSPSDLKIEAGPTPFTPGPMIGELGMLGIKTEVKDGKIHVKDEKVLVKEGDIISEKVASLLAKLGVEPMKVGLNLLLTYKDGEILEKQVLSVDEEEYINNLKLAHSTALNLAMHLGIINEDTIKPLVTKAQREANNISKNLPEETKPVEEVKEEVKEEPKVEEPVEEPKEEIKEEIKEEPQEVVEEKQEPKEEKPAEPIIKKEEIKEKKTTETPDMSQAQEVIKSIIGSKKPLEAPEETTEKTKKPEKKDINKLINELKDKKIRGEI